MGIIKTKYSENELVKTPLGTGRISEIIIRGGVVQYVVSGKELKEGNISSLDSKKFSENIVAQLSDLIGQYKKEFSCTFKDLGMVFGVRYSYIHQMSSGEKRNMYLSIFSKICHKLGIEPLVLLKNARRVPYKKVSPHKKGSGIKLDRNQIKEIEESDAHPRELAEKYGIHISTIHKHLRNRGKDKKIHLTKSEVEEIEKSTLKTEALAEKYGVTIACINKHRPAQRKFHHLTSEEIRKIKNSPLSGVGIAAELGVHVNTVYKYRKNVSKDKI